MPYVYILQNEKGRRYIGITALSPKERLKRHNKKEVRSTKHGAPWGIIFCRECSTLKQAREYEKLIKSWKGGNALKRLLSKTAGSSNGRIHDSESCHLGSNPSPAVLDGKQSGGVK